jgi:hypothetical protein
MLVFIGRSGVGKTSTIAQLATKHFVVYMLCSALYARASPGFPPDSNYLEMGREINNFFTTTSTFSWNRLKELDEKRKAKAYARTQVEILARFLFLRLLLEQDAELTPRNFFFYQLQAAGREAIAKLVTECANYKAQSVAGMLETTKHTLKNLLGPKHALIFAVDEAHIADEVLRDKLISPSALAKEKVVTEISLLTVKTNTGLSESMFDKRRGDVFPQYRRGYLTLLRAVLSHLGCPVILAGTEFSLCDAERVYTSIGKPDRLVKIVHFPVVSSSQVFSLLNSALDLSDCKIKDDQLLLLEGRTRFTARVITALFELPYTSNNTKQEMLDKAIEQSLQQNAVDISNKVSSSKCHFESMELCSQEHFAKSVDDAFKSEGYVSYREGTVDQQ